MHKYHKWVQQPSLYRTDSARNKTISLALRLQGGAGWWSLCSKSARPKELGPMLSILQSDTQHSSRIMLGPQEEPVHRAEHIAHKNGQWRHAIVQEDTHALQF